MRILGTIAAGSPAPSTPTIGTATAGDASASVSFTASSYIGKGTITYIATSSPSGFTSSAGASSPLTVTGLTNGTAYTFTVVGTTNYGVSSAASAASNSVSPVVAVPNSFESIATALPGSNASFTFNNIPNTFRHLQIRGRARTTFTTYDNSALSIQYNGDTSSQYNGHQIYAFGSSGIGAQSANTQSYYYVSYIQGANATNNYFSGVIIDILDANRTDFLHKTSRYSTGCMPIGSALQTLSVGSGLYYGSGSERISSVTVNMDDGLFVNGSHFALYGIKG